MQKDQFRRIEIELLKFTHQKDSDNIKLLLESYPRKIKGSIFEWYLAELYRGNGWLTKIGGRRGDADRLWRIVEPSVECELRIGNEIDVTR